MSEDWKPLVIAVAPNGAYKTKQDHPALPITPDEIACTAAECQEAGAAMIHLHVRDADGRHSLDADIYRAAIDTIRNAVGDRLVIQVTSEAAKRYQPAEQMAMVRAVKPEFVSLALREILPDDPAEREAAAFLSWMAGERIGAQFILYSADEVRRFQALQSRGVIPPGNHWLLFVLGRYTENQTSSPPDLLPFLAAHTGQSPWMMCAFGRMENACALTAAGLGGHARIGFENNLYRKDGRLAESNAELVAQARAASALHRPSATADTLREMLAAC